MTGPPSRTLHLLPRPLSWGTAGGPGSSGWSPFASRSRPGRASAASGRSAHPTCSRPPSSPCARRRQRLQPLQAAAGWRCRRVREQSGCPSHPGLAEAIAFGSLRSFLPLLTRPTWEPASHTCRPRVNKYGEIWGRLTSWVFFYVRGGGDRTSTTPCFPLLALLMLPTHSRTDFLPLPALRKQNFLTGFWGRLRKGCPC